MKRKWDSNNEASQRRVTDAIITYIEELTDTKIGVIAAQELTGIILNELAPEIYNMGLADAKKALQQKFYDLEVELDMLENKQ